MMGHRNPLPLVSSVETELKLVFNSSIFVSAWLSSSLSGGSLLLTTVQLLAQRDGLLLLKDSIAFHFVATL